MVDLFRPSPLDDNVGAFDVAEVTQAQTQCLDATKLTGEAQEPDPRDVDTLLRVRGERPGRRAAETRDELAPLQSITSSARASSVGGTVRPSALAPGVAAMSFERTKDPLAEGVRHY